MTLTHLLDMIGLTYCPELHVVSYRHPKTTPPPSRHAIDKDIDKGFDIVTLPKSGVKVRRSDEDGVHVLEIVRESSDPTLTPADIDMIGTATPRLRHDRYQEIKVMVCQGLTISDIVARKSGARGYGRRMVEHYVACINRASQPISQPQKPQK